jgi:hypothetical protein
MNDFFHKLIRGDTTAPPEPVLASLHENFSRPYNIEWLRRDQYYEAIFYIFNREYLARFRKDGGLVDYKVNMPVESLPSKILGKVRSRGEIMNAVVIHAGSGVRYEIIYRDRELNRFLLLIDENTVVISEKAL